MGQNLPLSQNSGRVRAQEPGLADEALKGTLFLHLLAPLPIHTGIQVALRQKAVQLPVLTQESSLDREL